MNFAYKSRLGILIIMLLPIVVYVLFYFFSPLIHSVNSIQNIENLSSWFVYFTYPFDGIELYVMSIVVPFVFCLTFFISNNLTLMPKHNQIFLHLILAVCFFWAIFLFYQTQFLTTESYIVSVSVLVVFILIAFLIRKINNVLFLFPLFFLLGIIVSYGPSLYNYSFFISPANKLIQGEMLGSFYMQYNLGITSLFAILQFFNFSIYAIHIVFLLVFILFFMD